MTPDAPVIQDEVIESEVVEEAPVETVKKTLNLKKK